MTWIDLGCDTGTFSCPAAALVGETGSVHAIDDSAEMLDHLQAKGTPSNLKLVHGDAGWTGLTDEIADLCILAFILHEVKEANRLVAEVFRLLRPGSTTVAVEWRSELDSPGPPMRIRLSGTRIKALLDEAGFSAFEYAVWSANHYWAKGCKPTIP